MGDAFRELFWVPECRGKLLITKQAARSWAGKVHQVFSPSWVLGEWRRRRDRQTDRQWEEGLTEDEEP